MMSGTESLASSQFHSLFLSSLSTRSSTSFAAHTVFTWARQMEGKGRKKQKTERERSKYNKFKISSRSHHEIGNLSARRSRGRCPLCVCPSILLLNWTTLLRRRHYCSCRFAMLFLSSFICMLPGSSGSFNSAVQLFSLFHSLLSLSLSLALSLSLFNCLFTLELLSSSSSSFSSKRRSSSVAEAYIIAAGAAQMQKRRELLVADLTTEQPVTI